MKANKILSRTDIEYIKKEYLNNKRSIKSIVQDVGCTWEMARNVLCREHVKIRAPGTFIRSDASKKEMSISLKTSVAAKEHNTNKIKVIDNSLLYNEYVNNNKTITLLCKQFNCNYQVVKRQLVAMGIKIRPQSHYYVFTGQRAGHLQVPGRHGTASCGS